MTTKKIILISIGAMIVSAALVFTLFWFINRPVDTPPENNGPRPGDALSAEQTPDYNVCRVLGAATIKKIFGDTMTELSSSQSSGVVGRNLEAAEQCSYTFTSPKSANNTLTIQTYLRSPTDNDAAVNPVGDPEWSVIPGRKIDHYVLFRASTSEEDGTLTYQTYVDAVTKAFLFTVTQPSDAIVIEGERSHEVMMALANESNYDVTEPDDAPPAPKI